MRVELTDLFVKKLKPDGQRYEYRDAVQKGFTLRLGEHGAKTWSAAVRVLISGKWRQTRVTLGKYPEMTLAVARQKAADVKEMARMGKDPRQAHREARRSLEAASRDTFGSVRDRFLQDCKDDLRASTHCEYARVLNSPLFDDWRDLPVTAISRRDVKALLKPLGKRVRANRTLAIMGIMFGWAANEDIIENVPTQHIKKPAEEKARQRVLKDDEIKLAWPVLDSFFRVLLLTGQRRGEVAGMRWDEIDLEKGVWTLAGARTKNGLAHVVPLSAPVLEILAKIPKPEWESPYVFSTDGGRKPINGFSKDKERIDEVMGYYGHELAPWVLHDLRRTAVTGMNDLGIAPHVVEQVVNHVSGSRAGVAGVYNRSEQLPERRRALERWAAHITALTSTRPMLKVVGLSA